ncbi:Uncharacterised protein [BD1-7 clade bacterium]|uniref:Phage abortive infection protein n=1 Tax=BD1-7 clade bacterium TaxID=2029982 RepID=A0A5S9QGT7_9GAMM|nr:Uncharacterised protein [BD1-7 clade bacterium]
MGLQNRILFAFLFLLPLIAYFAAWVVGGAHPGKGWSNFGSYAGGIYGALGFFAVAFTIYRNSVETTKLEQDNVFYKSMDTLRSRVESSHAAQEEGTLFKGLVERFSELLSNECMGKARSLLCERPQDIEDLFYGKIQQAIYGYEIYRDFTTSVSKMRDDLVNAGNYDQRWEKVKCYIGSTHSETQEIATALKALGSVWFYKISVQERTEMYSRVIADVEEANGEFIDGYMRTLKFVTTFISNAENKKLYKEYLHSQLSKYELVTIFYYVIANDDDSFICNLLDLEILDRILSQECRSLLIDAPSFSDLEKDVEALRERELTSA